ncbi:MAG: LCP family protein [Eubacterium sp.]|nr:LCP family protein [Eubacterium sp.]
MAYEDDLELGRLRQEAERRKRELEELQRQELQRIRELEQGKADRNGYDPELDSAFAVSGNEQRPNTRQSVQQNPDMRYDDEQLEKRKQQMKNREERNRQERIKQEKKNSKASQPRKRTFDPDQAVSDEEFISSYEDDDYDSDYDDDREYEERRRRKSREESESLKNRKDGRDDKKSKKKKKKSPAAKFFRRLVAILLILLLVFALAIGNITRRFKNLDSEVSKRPTAMKKGIVNVLLIGEDARDGQSGQRTDSMILMSINTTKNCVSMTSLMRDMYVDIPGYGGDRINAAYAYGGIDLLDQTIEENFGITIDGNAKVDFDGFLEAMTAVGDLDMDLTAEEAQYMNENPGFGSNNDASDEVWDLHEGKNRLTPSQLLAYSRIRYIGNSDWDRTERQRKVIAASVSRVKHGHFISGYKMATKAAPSIATDIGTWGMMRVAFGIITGGEMKSHIIPVEDTYYGDYIDGMDVLVPDLEQNRDYLQKYMNGEE